MKHGSILKALGHETMTKTNCVPIRGYSGYFFGPTEKGCKIFSGSRLGKFLEKKLYQKRKPNGAFYICLTDDNGKSRNHSFKGLIYSHLSDFQIVLRCTREELDRDFESSIYQLSRSQLRHDVVKSKYTEEELTKLHQRKYIETPDTCEEFFSKYDENTILGDLS